MTAPAQELVTIRRLTVDYRRQGQWRDVIRDLDLTIRRGEVLGLAGESGCGKSTLASMLLGETRSERRLRAGSIRFEDVDLFALGRRDLRRLRTARLALVPQNGGGSLTPTMRIKDLFAETLRACHPGMAGAARIIETQHLLAEVGLPDPTGALTRYPHQFSGGQQQRIVLALALAGRPDLLILDEPTTGQDAVTRRGIIDLLARLRRSSRMSMLYVSHDLATLGEISDRIAIMQAGEIVEIGPAQKVLTRPLHPYTRALVAALPRLDAPPDPTAALSGSLDRQSLPEGCRFAPRCVHAEAQCRVERQVLRDVGAGQSAACRRLAERIHAIAAPRALPERITA